MRAKFLTSILTASLSLVGCGGEGGPPNDSARRAAEQADAERRAAEQNILGPALEAPPASIGDGVGDNQAEEPANSAQGNGAQDPRRSPST